MRRSLLAVLLISTVLIGAIPGVDGQQTVVRDADLAVDQPAYLNEGVQQRTVNGTTQYQVAGGPVELQPQNIAGEVVNFGVSTPGGELRYDEAMTEYVFSADTSGTYDLYWVASQTVETATNTTGANTTNATNATAANETSTTRQVRYEAQIRVDTADVEPVASGRISDLRNNSQKWAEFNESVQDLRQRDFILRPDDRSTDEVIQGMIQSYITTSSPLSALSGNATAVLLIMATTLGGALVFMAFFGYNALSIASLRNRLNRFETNESDEGELADRKVELELEERLQTAAGTDLQDIDAIGDYWGDIFRETHGPSLRAAWESLLSHSNQILADWLAVMCQNGYAVLVDGDDVRVVREDEADGNIVEPENLTDERLAAVDAASPPVSTFDIDSADINWEALPEERPTLDLQQWVDNWQLDIDHDADLEAYGERLVALCDAVEDHELTDSDGSVRPQRAYLEAMLDGAYSAERYKLPGATMLRGLLERSLQHHSPAERVDQTVKDIQSGRYNAGDD